MAGANKLVTAGGGGVVLTPASSIASDVTVNIPSRAGNLAMDGPAFSAWVASANQTISTGVFTKIALSVEGFDTNSNFDSTTNYRFQPTVAGYYQINASVDLLFTVVANYEWLGTIAKNGDVDYQRFGNTFNGNCPVNPSARQFDGSTLLYLNGSTDYIELYVYQSSGANATAVGNSAAGKYTRMSASLVRAV